MSSNSEASWGEIAALLVLGIFLTFVVVSCQNGHKDECRATGGTPLTRDRSTHVYCVYTDGRPPAEFNMEK